MPKTALLIGAGPADVRGVLVTHMHFDHIGLAGAELVGDPVEPPPDVVDQERSQLGADHRVIVDQENTYHAAPNHHHRYSG